MRMVDVGMGHVRVADACVITVGAGDALAELDETLGTIMQAVKDAGVDDNTIQFFSSDNGPWLIHQLNGGSAGLFRDGACAASA